MTENRIKFGIIGTGGIAVDAHGPALLASEKACLTSVLSRSGAKAEKFAGKYKTSTATVSAYDSLDSFLADPALDAVIVTVPDKLHFQYAHAALLAGKHVLVEKPMCTQLDQAISLNEYAESKRLVLGVGFHLRFHPGVEKILELVANDELGTLRHIVAQWTFYRSDSSDWRASNELGKWWSLAGTGSHCIDLCHRVAETAGLTCESITGMISGGVHTAATDESATVMVSYTGTCSAVITSSVLFDAPTIFNIYGDKGYIETSGLLGRRSNSPIYLNGTQVPYSIGDPFVNQIDSFCRAIKLNSVFDSDGSVGVQGVRNLIKLTKQ